MLRFRILILVSTLIFLPLPVVGGTPDIELERLEGGTQSLTRYIGKGKWVVVNVWSPTCNACVIELPSLLDFRNKYRDEITVLGITIDFPSFGYGKRDVINTFLKKYPLDYPLFLADMNSASMAIGNRLVGIPLIAIFHPDGRVLARWPGTINVEELEEFINNYKDYVIEDGITEDF